MAELRWVWKGELGVEEVKWVCKRRAGCARSELGVKEVNWVCES